jgi:hypothetical protein
MFYVGEKIFRLATSFGERKGYSVKVSPQTITFLSMNGAQTP